MAPSSAWFFTAHLIGREFPELELPTKMVGGRKMLNFRCPPNEIRADYAADLRCISVLSSRLALDARPGAQQEQWESLSQHWFAGHMAAHRASALRSGKASAGFDLNA